MDNFLCSSFMWHLYVTIFIGVKTIDSTSCLTNYPLSFIHSVSYDIAIQSSIVFGYKSLWFKIVCLKIKMNQHSRVLAEIVASEIAKLSSIQPKLISIQIIGDFNKTCEANGELIV